MVKNVEFIPNPKSIGNFIPIHKGNEDNVNLELPNWFNEKNLEAIISGNYQDIKPITAEFVTTLNCNYRCTQCAYEKPKKDLGMWMKDKENGEKCFVNNFSSYVHMNRETMQTSIDRLIEGGVNNILFTGGGEPLMNPVTIEGMQRAKDKGGVVALYTNGRLLNQDKIDNILNTDPLFVRISVYGGNETSFGNYVQIPKEKETYKKVMKNIETFAKTKRETGSNTNFGLSYLVHPINANSINEFANTILDLNSNDLKQIDYIRFTPAVDYFGGEQQNQNFIENIFKNVVEEVMPRFEDSGVEIKPYYHRVKDLNSTKSYSTCRASGWFVEVGPSGETYLCCEKHFMPEYKIGDLRNQSIEEIWNGQLRKDVINKVNDSNCTSCPTLCKPHELNKVFDIIDKSRNNGEIDFVSMWVEEMISRGKKAGYCPGKLDNFQS